MKIETIKTGKIFRNATIELTQNRDESGEPDRCVELAFSSEEPYRRHWGIEILDHGPGSIDTKFIGGGTAPLLVDHDPTALIGVVEEVSLGADRVARARVRFGKSDRAEREFRDVQDKIRRNVSVGYRIKRMKLEKSSVVEENETYRVTEWEPLEISLVSIPADTTVGVGRSATDEEFETIIEGKEEKETTMSQATNEPTVDVKAVIDAERASERKRIKDITDLACKHQRRDLADEHIAKGTSIEAFRGIILDNIAPGVDLDTPVSHVGLSQAEAKRFSLMRAINAAASNNWKDAPFEKEVSDQIAKQLSRDARGFFVPYEVQKRDLTSLTAGAGGNLVGTDHLGGEWINLLRNQMVIRSLGARVLSGLKGNVAIPRLSGAGTAYWVAQNGATTESNQTFEQLALSPKTVGTYTDIGRTLMTQSDPSAERLVMEDLAQVIGIEMDRVAVHGSGLSNEPTGIIATSGIGNVAGGQDGLAPAWSHIVELETDVAVANAAVGKLAYLTNAKVRGKLKQVEKATNTAQFVWGDGETPLNGYKAAVSNIISSTLTKGNSSGVCSAIVFGNWADLVIGEWGIIDFLVDPYTGSAAGTVRVRVLMDTTVGVRHAASFSAMLDALTA